MSRKRLGLRQSSAAFGESRWSAVRRRELQELLRDALGAVVTLDLNPPQLKLPPKPSHLAFRELPRPDFHQLDGLGERAFAAQVFRDLAITQGLRRRQVLGQAALQ